MIRVSTDAGYTMTFLDVGPYLLGIGAVALVGGFSARPRSWGIGLMYVGVLMLLGTALVMILKML